MNFIYKDCKDGFYIYAPPTKYKNVDDAVDYVVRVDVFESVIDFMKKLILHIPNEQFKMIRYYGFYASSKPPVS